MFTSVVCSTHNVWFSEVLFKFYINGARLLTGLLFKKVFLSLKSQRNRVLLNNFMSYIHLTSIVVN